MQKNVGREEKQNMFKSMRARQLKTIMTAGKCFNVWQIVVNSKNIFKREMKFS